MALIARQVIAARRGRYIEADRTFIATSLRKLVPGEQTEEAIKRLADNNAALGQLIAPSNDAGTEEVKVVELTQVRLYELEADVENRIGKDVQPLAAYIKSLEKTLVDHFAKADKPSAKGLLVAVGIKAGKKSRIWCQATEGTIPDESLRSLEGELAKIEAINLKRSPFAFAMEITLYGQKGAKFPEFPDVWVEAVKKTANKVIVPPDKLFKAIWPD